MTTKTVLKLICMLCGKEVGEKDGEGQSGNTSTVCPECADIWFNIKLKGVKEIEKGS